jgi:hypothetical protein
MCKRISDLYARQMADKREMQEAGTRSAGQSAAGGSARTSVSPGPGVALSLSWSWAIRASSTPFRSGRRWIKGANRSSLAQATVLAHLAVASLRLGSKCISERYEEDKARDTEAVQRFLWEDSLLGGWRSSTGLDGRAEQPRE